MKTLFALLAGALAMGAAGSAPAQKVYRCGPDGRIYQQTACADGKAVDASDPRTAEQRQAAQAVAKSEAKTAAEFDRDRLPASAPKGGKSGKASKADASPAPNDRPASGSTKAASKKAAADDAKPLVFLAPKPKDAASAAK